MKYTVESDIGLKRSINEDRAAFFRREDGVQLALVADGMGGHNAGDVASTMATVEARKLFYDAHAEHFETPSTKKAWLLQTVENSIKPSTSMIKKILIVVVWAQH